ncbi:MAG TPA: FAD-binding protein, partial [Dehalococcoidia bacterium]|nr:FAD-binding protein [Dehalococcoidia bacterium]
SQVDLPGYTSEPGQDLEDEALVRALCAEAPRQVERAQAMGIPLEAGRYFGAGRYFLAKGGDRVGGGNALTRALVAVTSRTEGIRAVEGCSLLGLLQEDGRVGGASGLTAQGGWLSIYARSTVLATGGGAGIYQVASTPRSLLGDGYVMALKAGLKLANLEIVEFFPVGIFLSPARYMHSGVHALLAREARLINAQGEDIVRKHLGIALHEGMAVVTVRFQWLSRAVGLEMETGPVFLDLTRLTAEDWEGVPLWNLRKFGTCPMDLRATPVPILPMAQTFHGGVLINPDTETSLEGLFAAGEVTAGAYAGERGANTLGIAITLGGMAGRNAADAARGLPAPKEGAARDGALEEVEGIAGKEGKIRPGAIRDEGKRLLYQYAGPVRTGAGLQAGLGKLRALAGTRGQMRCHSLRDLREALEVEALLLLGQAVMQAALLRTESRGSHYRADFPGRDDRRCGGPIFVSYDPDRGETKLETPKPV